MTCGSIIFVVREIERYIVTLIAGGVPNEVILGICSLMDFRYLGQLLVLTSQICTKMLNCLKVFHSCKDSIMAAKGRVGKGGKPLNHWNITKLELLQGVVPNIIVNGVPSQYSADITEHAHVTEIKKPAHSGNNQNYESQIVQALDRQDKCQRFDLATSIRHANVSFQAMDETDSDNDSESDIDGGVTHHSVDTTSKLLSHIHPVSKRSKTRTLVSFFDLAKNEPMAGTSKPFRVFSAGGTAFRFSRDPSVKSISISEAGHSVGIVDLEQAFFEFLDHLERHGDAAPKLCGRRNNTFANLPFTSLQVWYRMRIQNRAFHYPHEALPAQTLNCLPPCEGWPYGHHDSVLFNIASESIWPESGISGKITFKCIYAS